MKIKVKVIDLGGIATGDTITTKANKVLDTVRGNFRYELLTAAGQSTGEVFDGETILAFRKDATGVAHTFKVGQIVEAACVVSKTTPGLWWPRFEGLGRRAIASDVLTKHGYTLD